MMTIINGRPTRFTVVGAGAIGGLMGAGLAENGASVTLVDRDPDHVAAMAERGLTIDGEGTKTCVRIRALMPDHVQGPLETVILSLIHI